MPDIALHELPAVVSLTGAEIVPVDDGRNTGRTTVNAIRSGLAPAGHGHTVADIAGLQSALDGKAASTSPTFTGSVTVSEALSADRITLASGINIVANAVYDGGMWRYRGNGPAVQLAQFANDATVRLYTAPVNGAGPLAPAAVAPQLAILHTPDASHWITLTGAAPGGRPAIGSSSGQLDIAAIPHLPSYTRATLPAATARGLVHVSDGAGGRRLAVSDGASWLWPDGTPVS